jgi:hypothetical protein
MLHIVTIPANPVKVRDSRDRLPRRYLLFAASE